MGFSGLATMAFAIGSFQEDKTISNLLGFSPYEMIIPGLISFFVHFWLLGFFQKRLSLDSDLKNYVGQYKDGKYDGQGTLTLADGRKYVGQFKDGKFDGQGTYTWPSGNKYVGQYKDGKYDGQGTYTWPDGNKYVGQWKDGKKNGQGTYTWPDGQKYVGQYKDGKKVSASYIDPMDDNVTSEGGDKVRDSQQIGFDIWEMASEEYDNNRNTGIWAMAFAESEGNEDKAKALYLKTRAEQLGQLSAGIAVEDAEWLVEPIKASLYMKQRRISEKKLLSAIERRKLRAVKHEGVLWVQNKSF